MKLLLLALAKPLVALGGFAGIFAYRDFPPQPADNPPIGIEEIVPAPEEAVEVVPAVEEEEPDDGQIEADPDR